MILEHLPVLQIVIPLMSAPVCVLIRRGRAALAYAIAVTWLVFAMAVALLARVLATGTIVYRLGNWASPWGIEYRVDVLGAFVILFVAAIGAVVLTWSPRSLAAEIPRDRLYLFCSVYLLCLTGLLGITVTGDLFNLFVFLEITSLSSYALISLGTDRRALAAAFRYLVMGTAGATFYLIGVGFLYLMTGTLNMMDMARLLPAVEGVRTVHVAFAFITVGIALKMALFPLHLWLPNAYAYAPSTVTAFLAATATKVMVYVFLRVVYTVFGEGFAFGTLHLNAVLMPVALAGILVASTVAIFQRNIKRMLAYSSVAQIGYMVLGLSFGAVTGLTAGIVHLFNHAMMKGGMFLAMGCIALRAGSVEIDDLRGIGRRMPVTMAAWVVGGLGLIGVPVTVGFVSKWYLVQAALESGLWPVAALVLLSSLLALAYVWRVVEIAYFQPPPEGSPRIPEAPLSMLVPVWILIGATVVFGLWTPLSLGVARKAAEVLLGGAP
jgi:multicomponent Na+:H+ antiporter subunit D